LQIKSITQIGKNLIYKHYGIRIKDPDKLFIISACGRLFLDYTDVLMGYISQPITNEFYSELKQHIKFKK